jgi:phospholipid-transporting ATPase
VSAVKDIFEDMKRHKSDGIENNRAVIKLDRKEKKFIPDQWKHLKVG